MKSQKKPDRYVVMPHGNRFVIYDTITRTRLGEVFGGANLFGTQKLAQVCADICNRDEAVKTEGKKTA